MEQKPKVYLVGSMTFAEVESIWEEPRSYARDRDLADFAAPEAQGAFTSAEAAMAHGIKSITADIREAEEETLEDLGDGTKPLPELLDERMRAMRWVDSKEQLVDQNWCPLARRKHSPTGKPEDSREYGNPQYVIYLESPPSGEEKDWHTEGCVVVEELEVNE